MDTIELVMTLDQVAVLLRLARAGYDRDRFLMDDEEEEIWEEVEELLEEVTDEETL